MESFGLAFYGANVYQLDVMGSGVIFSLGKQTMASGIALMARLKRSAKPTDPSPSASAEERTTIINLKGSLLYDQWLEDMHQKTHLSKAVIVRLALKHWAESNGHSTPPDI